MIVEIAAVATLLIPILWLLWMVLTRRIVATAMVPAVIPQAPGPCELCSGTTWIASGRERIMPAMGIRSFQFSMTGLARVRAFTCKACGSYGVYGMSVEQPERGWILLTNYNLGF